MTLTVRLFGAEAVAAGTDAVQIQVTGPARADTILAALASQHRSLAPFIAGARLARNHDFAAADALINESDELAIIGLVSGG